MKKIISELCSQYLTTKYNCIFFGCMLTALTALSQKEHSAKADTLRGDTLDLRNCNWAEHIIPRDLSPVNEREYKAILLDCNNIEDIGSFDLRGVEYLSLEYNPIRTISPKFPLTSLKRVNITDTQIWDFPQAFCECTHLRRIDHYRGFFIHLPACFSNLDSLEVLNVDYIRVDSVMRFPPRLQNLSISCTKGTAICGATIDQRIMKEIGKLNNLQRLRISEFNLTASDLGALGNKHSLKALSLWLQKGADIVGIVHELSGWHDLQMLELVVHSRTFPDCLSDLTNVDTLIVRRRGGAWAKVSLPKSIEKLNLRALYVPRNLKQLDIDWSHVTLFVQNASDIERYRRRGYQYEEATQNPIYIAP